MTASSPTEKGIDMFFHKKKEVRKTYDPAVRKPLIRVSICTGEQTAGFRNLKTNNFEEVMLIRDEADMEEFRNMYGIESEIEHFY